MATNEPQIEWVKLDEDTMLAYQTVHGRRTKVAELHRCYTAAGRVWCWKLVCQSGLRERVELEIRGGDGWPIEAATTMLRQQGALYEAA